VNRRQRRAAAALNRTAAKRSPVSALVHSTRGGLSYAEDGRPLVVARPSDPAVAMMAAEVAVRHQDQAMFQAIPDDDYRLMGYLSADGQSILDPRDLSRVVGTIEIGDSLITLDGSAASN
jgi:hypothetical protein